MNARKPSQIAAERARNARTQTVTVRFDRAYEGPMLELLRVELKAQSAPDALKMLFIREITKRGIDMR